MRYRYRSLIDVCIIEIFMYVLGTCRLYEIFIYINFLIFIVKIYINDTNFLVQKKNEDKKKYHIHVSLIMKMM